MAKKPPEPAKVDSLGEHAPARAQWNSFSGSRLALDKIATVDRPASSTELNIADFASAARARTASSAATELHDALSTYRKTAKWDAKEIAAAFVKPVEEEDDPKKKKKRRRRDADPEGLVAAARAVTVAAIWGEAKGVRSLALAVARSDQLDPDQRRKIDGIARAAGNRKLTLANLHQLCAQLCVMAGPKEDSPLERTTRLVSGRDSLRLVGDLERSVVSPRQLFDIRGLEAYLIIVDMPVREASKARRGPGFTRVVVLLRDVKGELVLIDPHGLHDPAKGSDDKEVLHVVLRKPDELAVKEYLGGLRAQAPLSPVARLAWNGYLSSVPPKTLASVEISVVCGSAFRYC